MFYNILHLPTSQYLGVYLSVDLIREPIPAYMVPTYSVAGTSYTANTTAYSTASYSHRCMVRVRLGNDVIASFSGEEYDVMFNTFLCQSISDCDYVINKLVRYCDLFSSADEFCIVTP